MAKIYRAEVYIIDYDNEFEDAYETSNEIKRILERNSDCLIDVVDIQGSKEFYWHDELKVNRTYTTKEDYDYYFNKNRHEELIVDRQGRELI